MKRADTARPQISLAAAELPPDEALAQLQMQLQRKRPANYRIAACGLMSSNFKLCGRRAATASGVLAPGRCSKR